MPIANEVASAASVAFGAAVSSADAGGSPTEGAQPLIHRNRSRGIEPPSSACAPRWKRDRDVPWSVEAAAWDALDQHDDEVA